MAFLQRTMNRGSVSTGYDIDNSLKFESDNSEYLKAEGRPQGNQQTWTWSCWLKRTEVTNGVIAQYMFSAGSDGKLGLYFRDDSSSNGGDTIFIYVDEGNSLKWIGELRVSFRDTSAWYHIVFAVDSTDGTAADRTKIYVNGVQQTITFNATLNQNVSTRIGDSGGKLSIGAKMDGSYEFNGYMAEVVLVDGSQLTPTSFGEFDDDSGIWKPKDVSSLSLGTTGFYMNFDDSSDLGKVQTGTSQGDFDLNNITAADQSTDTPTNNFATLNQIALDGSVGSSGNITQGATKATATEFDVFITFAPTFGVTSGKWYAEFEYEGSQADNLVGILDIDAVVPYNSRLGKAGQWSVGFYQANGKLYVTADSGVTSIANWGASATNGDIISVAVDMDNHFVYFAKNGTYQNSGVPTSGATGTGGVAFDSNKTVGIGCSSYDQGGDEGQIFTNYGGFTAGTISSAASDANGYGTFEYAPPSGYYALCGKNLAEYGGTA